MAVNKRALQEVTKIVSELKAQHRRELRISFQAGVRLGKIHGYKEGYEQGKYDGMDKIIDAVGGNNE